MNKDCLKNYRHMSLRYLTNRLNNINFNTLEEKYEFRVNMRYH